MGVRGRKYSSMPWTEAAKARRKEAERKAFWDQILVDILCMLVGAFAVIAVQAYYPFPWW